MKKLIASIGIAAVLAFGLVFGRAATPAGTVGACGWYIENENSASQSFYDGYYGQYTYLDVTLVTWNDGCGDKQYESLASVRDHAPASYTTAVRVWVCGPYKGRWTSSSSVVWSPVYYYGSCSRSADNGPSGSSAYNSLFVPTTVTKYVSEG